MRALFKQVMQQAKDAQLFCDEHFSVDGTLIRAWAPHKSFVPKDGPPPPNSGSRGTPEVDFKAGSCFPATVGQLHQPWQPTRARLIARVE